MTLASRLQEDLTAAIRERDELRRDTLRMVIAAAYNMAKQARRELTDDEVIQVLTREVKTRNESVEAYAAAGRARSCCERERAEIEIIRGYLPEQLDEAELERLVSEAVAESGATSPRDMGKVMGVLMPRVRGRADGKQVSALVARQLARRDALDACSITRPSAPSPAATVSGFVGVGLLIMVALAHDTRPRRAARAVPGFEARSSKAWQRPTSAHRVHSSTRATWRHRQRRDEARQQVTPQYNYNTRASAADHRATARRVRGRRSRRWTRHLPRCSPTRRRQPALRAAIPSADQTARAQRWPGSTRSSGRRCAAR